MEVLLVIGISSVISTIICRIYQEELIKKTLDINEKFLIEMEKITVSTIREFRNKEK